MGETLVAPYVAEQGLLNACLGRGADFEVYTDALKVDENAEPGHYIVNMIGSSTVQDLQGDIMKMSALDDMTTVPDGMLIWLDHSYSVPSDLFGSLYGRPWIKSASGIADLHLSAEVETDNPRALQTYNMITKGRRKFGCSIGCQVLDYEYDDTIDALIINRVQVVEWSVVGIPAQQRCWVEIATKSLFERSLLDGRGDDALRLAPAVKGMHSRSYDTILKHIESPGLRRDLEHVTPRGTSPHRIMTAFNDGEAGFALVDRKGITKSLSRDEVSTLLAKEPTMDDLTAKAATGKTSWPLMDIRTEWTGSKAEKQIFAWARNDQDEIVASKAKQCFLYCNPDDSDKQSGYKMPFCYIPGEAPQIVPLGVRAAAGVLAGGMGGGKFGGDDAAMKAKVKTMYGRINSQFSPDPEWVVPWEKDDKEKSVEKDILGTDSGGELIRQDLAENGDDMEVTKAADVKVASDGTHEACTGSHSHAHKAFGTQGNDEQHSHEHSHDGDSAHEHSHAEKAAEAEHTTESEPERVKETLQEETHTEVVDPARIGLLAAYNAIGKQLGFDEQTLEKKSIDNPADMQAAISCISEADRYIDQAMALLGIPDADDVDDVDAPAPSGPSPLLYSMDAQFTRSLRDFMVKEGRELSTANVAVIKTMHDLCASMHPDVCKGASMGNQGTDVENARQDAEYQMGNENGAGKAYEPLTEAMQLLAKALDNLHIPAITNEVQQAQKALDTIKQQIGAKDRELKTLSSNIAALSNAPLGRPTQLNRSIVGEASYVDMKLASGERVTPQDILALTSVKAIGQSRYRYWPSEVGNGMRPELSTDQKSLMHPYDVIAYQDGKEAYIPMIDDPVGI